MEPIFLLDLHDRATGKRVAVRLAREVALLPLGELLARTLRGAPEPLVAAGRLHPAQADTFFRLQDLVYPTTARGALHVAPYAGLVLRHQEEGVVLDPDLVALFDRVRRDGAPDALVLPIEIDRRRVRFDRRWRGFHARRYDRFRPAVERLLAVAALDGLTRDGPLGERLFIEAVARRIWQADFENYSRFLPPDGPGALGPIRLKTGDETVESIADGRGGVCVEKVAALKFITDAHGLRGRVVFAGPGASAEALPVAQLRTMLDHLDSYDFTYARRYLRYWDHVALEFRLSDGTAWLVDPSNGNIPFLCARSSPYLSRGKRRRSVPVRMLAVEEPVTYYRAPESLGLDFLFAWETFVQDVDLLQVFDNHLGLLVADDVYVTALMWGSVTKRAVARDRWRAYAAEHGLVLGLRAEDGGTAAEAAVVDAFAARRPAQHDRCAAALPGLARRYQDYILARYGIDKPFGADLVVLDRRSLPAASSI